MQEAATWEATAIQETQIIHISVYVMAEGSLGMGYSVCTADFFLSVLLHLVKKKKGRKGKKSSCHAKTLIIP